MNTAVRPWIHSGAETPRRAGVNAFGFGGINAHAILEETPAAVDAPIIHQHSRWESELILLQADSPGQLAARLEQVQRFLESNPHCSLADLAYTWNVLGPDGSARVALVADSVADLQQKLGQARTRLSDPDCKQIKDVRGIYYFAEPLAQQGRIAFLFPGEGSQYPNMLADLCLHFPDIRQRFDEIERIYADHSRGFLPSDNIFPHPAFSEEERRLAEKRIWQMEEGLEAVLTADRALYDMLHRLEIKPDAIAGHSAGEFAAMVASGMIDLDGDDSLRQFSLEMNENYHAVPAGEVSRMAVLAVAAGIETVEEVAGELGERVQIAMDNCPHQTVVVCEEQDVPQVTQVLGARGLIYERLSFDRPYHTPHFSPYANRLPAFYEKWIVGGPQVPTYSCTTVSVFPDDRSRIQEIALAHWLEPVSFRRTVETMYADGLRLFVEVGTGGNLTSFVGDILRGKPHLALAANTKSRSGITQLAHLVGALAAQGVPVQLDYLYSHRSVQAVDLDGDLKPEKSLMGTVTLATGLPEMTLSPETVTALQKRGETAPPVAAGPVGVEQQGGEQQEREQQRAEQQRIEQSRAGRTGERDDGTEKESRENQPDIPVSSQKDLPMRVNGTQNSAPPHRSAPPVVQPHGSYPAGHSGVTQVMLAHLHTMEQFLATQQAIMQAYLTGRSAASLPPLPNPSEAPLPLAAPDPVADVADDWQRPQPIVPAQAPAAPFPEPMPQPTHFQAPAPIPQEQTSLVPAPPVPIPSEQTSPDLAVSNELDIGDLLLTLLAERTGYPPEMLDPDLDLEADLGIDSIKRVEILGLLQQELGFDLSDEMEELSKQKTLRGIRDFLATRVGG